MLTEAVDKLKNEVGIIAREVKEVGEFIIYNNGIKEGKRIIHNEIIDILKKEKNNSKRVKEIYKLLTEIRN